LFNSQMKKLIFTLLFTTLVFSSPTYAGWTFVDESEDNVTFYVDKIKKRDGYVYFWQLADNPRPENSYFSVKVYHQVDCKAFRIKALQYFFYTEPMGKGKPRISNNDTSWHYAPPGSSLENILDYVCL